MRSRLEQRLIEELSKRQNQGHLDINQLTSATAESCVKEHVTRVVLEHMMSGPDGIPQLSLSLEIDGIHLQQPIDIEALWFIPTAGMLLLSAFFFEL